MDTTQLSQDVTDTLAKQIDGSVFGSEQAISDRLFTIVRRHFKAQGEGTSFDAFENEPHGSSKAIFVEKLARELQRNAEFKSAVVETRFPATGSSINQTTVTASGRSKAVGRDDRSTTDKSRHTNFGGIVVAVIAIAVVLIVILVGRAVYIKIADVIAANTLSGTSTCTDYIGSSDDAAKSQVMKKLYLKYGKTQEAADPFIIQNTEYICSANPKVTLDRIANH